MERAKENEEQSQGEENRPLVSSIVLREDIVNLLDFVERLSNGRVQISARTYNIEELISELTLVSAFFHLHYSFFSEGCNDEMSCISNEIHDLVQSLLHRSGEDMLVNLKYDDVSCLVENIKSYFSSHSYAEPSRVTMTEGHLVELLDASHMYLQYLPKGCSELILPSMTRYELLQNVFGNLRYFHRLNVNGSVEYEAVEYVLPQLQLMAQRVVNFSFNLLDYRLDESRVYFKLAKLLVEVIPVELEVMHICSTTLKASKSEEVGRFIKQLLEDSPNILRESLIHLQEYMVNVVTPSSSASNVHVMIEFLLIILTDVPKDIIHHDKLFVLLVRVGALTKEVFVLVHDLEEHMNATGLNLLENIEILKEDLKNVFLKARADSSQLCFPMSDGSLFMNLLLRHLNDLLDSNTYSVALIEEEIRRVKEDLELITLFLGKVEQELNRDLWARVLDVAYAAEHAINSIIVRDHGLLQLIFSLPDTVEKIKLVKNEVQEKISKKASIVLANSPNKPVEKRSSTADKTIVGFEEERAWIIRKLISGPAEIDVISIVGMLGLGKTTLANRVYTDKFIVDHFDVRAWCTVDQERNEKKLLQKIYNQVIGLKEGFSEDNIDDDIADKLRKQLFRKRYLIVLDDLWDTATWDEITRSFPSEFEKGSRVILTTRIKEVALYANYHSDPLSLRLLTPEESWELLEKRIFREKSCPDELKDVGVKIAQSCCGLPLVLDLMGGVIARKEKKKALWLEVLYNLSSFIFYDEEEVMKRIVQLSYDHKIIVGFEEERKRIIRMLTSGPAEIDVISIVGMPGLGKTTLADRVYNEKFIVEHFDVRAWCTVSQEQDEKKLLQKIYNQVIDLKERFSEDDIDDDVADKLRRKLFGKRYLIVLDDLWDTATWDEITRSFPPKFQKGSRVILTTRKKKVALHAKYCSDPLDLRLLTPEESWELLEKRIFGEKSCPDELKYVGEMIARECDGLPLVLDLIGGVIARKEKKEALLFEVLNNLSSFIFDDEEEVMKIVQLSYDHLSDHLKLCLIYLASYPKGKYILISDLKYLWSAEGLMEQTAMKVNMNELISSSLVSVSKKRGLPPICQIHDLVHDFCSRKAGKEKLFVLTSSSALSSSSSDLMPRRMTVHYDKHSPSSDVNFVLLDAEKENPYVKRLLSLKVYMDEYEGSQLPYKCHLRHLRLLKSLELCDITLTDSLLNEIGMLVHLKFLHILTEAEALPLSFSNLRNLETLVVDSLEGSCMILSPVIWSLAKLRDVSMQCCSLFNPHINALIVLDEDSKLENLRTLYHLYLPGSEDTEDIFKRFPNLQILRVWTKQQLPRRSEEKICFPRFDVLNELEKLRVQVSRDSFSEYMLEFPSSLRKLDLKGINLTSDSLSRIARLSNLQKLCLSYAVIEGEKEWNMEEVTFQNLRSLNLDTISFSKWQVDGEKSFPVLEELAILFCKELIEIPDSFGDIASLKFISVVGSPQLKESALSIQRYVADMTEENKLEVDC